MKVIDAFYRLEPGDKLPLRRGSPSGQIVGTVEVLGLGLDTVLVQGFVPRTFVWVSHTRAYICAQELGGLPLWLDPSEAL